METTLLDREEKHVFIALTNMQYVVIAFPKVRSSFSEGSDLGFPRGRIQFSEGSDLVFPKGRIIEW